MLHFVLQAFHTVSSRKTKGLEMIAPLYRKSVYSSTLFFAPILQTFTSLSTCLCFVHIQSLFSSFPNCAIYNILWLLFWLLLLVAIFAYNSSIYVLFCDSTYPCWLKGCVVYVYVWLYMHSRLRNSTSDVNNNKKKRECALIRKTEKGGATTIAHSMKEVD